eukprot:UN12105
MNFYVYRIGDFLWRLCLLSKLSCATWSRTPLQKNEMEKGNTFVTSVFAFTVYSSLFHSQHYTKSAVPQLFYPTYKIYVPNWQQWLPLISSKLMASVLSSTSSHIYKRESDDR